MVNSFRFDEVNNHWFVNKVCTMLAVFYPAISNLCYCLSENVLGIVYQVLFRKKKNRFLLFYSRSQT